MSAGFWKRNEKVIMTLLLLVLAPSFAFTGLMTMWLSDRANAGAIYEIFGEKVTLGEYQTAKDKLAKQNVANRLRAVGPFGFPPYQRPPGAGDQQTLNYLIMMHEVDKLGLRPGGALVQDVLREAALDVLTWYRVMEDRNWVASGQDAYTAYTAERATATYNPDEYRVALMSGKFGVKLTVEDFEEAVLESSRATLLDQIVGGIAVASEKEMYDEYFLTRQKRSVDYVQVSSDRFMDQAREQIDEDYLREVYEANTNLYRKSAAFTLEVAKADRAKFTDPDFEPSLEQIRERYEVDKATRYKVPRAADWVAPEGHNPEVDDYRDLTVVFTQVEASVRASMAEEQEKVVLEAAIAKAAELDTAGTEYTLQELFPEDVREKIIFDTVDWFTTAELGTMDFKYRNYAVLRTLFNDASEDRVGEVSAEPVPVQDGDYMYRIAGVEGPRTETFEEAIAKVTTNAERKRAKELGVEYLAEEVAKIREDEAITFESFAAAENYTVHKSEEPLDRNSGYKLKINDRQVVAGRTLMFQIFDETSEVGDVTNPVVYEYDDNIYIGKLTEIVPPEMDQWLAAKPGLEQQVLNRRRTSIGSRFQAELEARAQPKYIGPVQDPDAG